MPKALLTHLNKEFELESNRILYDALADQGLDLPHGCLAGSCGACRIELHSGAENLTPPSYIELNTLQGIQSEYEKKKGADFLKSKTIRLACRCKIMGDISFSPLAPAK